MTDLDRRLGAQLRADGTRMRLLRAVASLGLPDAWIGAGFVRSAVWDALHERAPSLEGDVDVIWFDRSAAAVDDQRFESVLRTREPGIDWSVKNQARMHARNGDDPYATATDAMRFWPETATAVAVRLTDAELEVAAPFGLDDLFSGVVRPTPRFTGEKRPIFEARVASKRWLARWPRLRMVEPGVDIDARYG